MKLSDMVGSSNFLTAKDECFVCFVSLSQLACTKINSFHLGDFLPVAENLR